MHILKCIIVNFLPLSEPILIISEKSLLDHKFILGKYIISINIEKVYVGENIKDAQNHLFRRF